MSGGTLTFYVSENSDKSNAVSIGTGSIGFLSSGLSRTDSHQFSSSHVPKKKYIWACITATGDINASNNCSGTFELKNGGIPIGPIMLLLDDTP
jgi:hypothetical protein